MKAWKVILFPEVATPNGLGPENLRVMILRESPVQPSPIDHLILNQQSAVDKASQVHLYDGPLLRLDALIPRDGETVELHISKSSYFQYWFKGHDLRTNLTLRKLGLFDAGDQTLYLPEVIGNYAVIVTADHKVILVRRSKDVATFRGAIDLPGGHPTAVQFSDTWTNGNFLFTAMEEEMFEELGITGDMILLIRNIAWFRNPWDGYKIEMLFYVKLNVTSGDFTRISHQEHDIVESEEVMFIDWLDWKAHRDSMTAGACLALTIASRHIN